MHITAGKFRKQPIFAPKGLTTRPTPSMVREAIFNICQNSIEGARVLDLFAGSGIISFEAISRGATESVLIDSDRQAKACIMKNIEKFQLESTCTFFQGDVFKTCSKLATSFDFIYADPPYEKGLGEQVVEMIENSSLLKPQGLLFVEEGKEMKLDSLKKLHLIAIRKYGRTFIHQFEMG